MPSILNTLKENPYLIRITPILGGYPQKTYLVGGFLRDLFLKNKKNRADLDFAISSSAIRVSRQIAKSLGCGFVVLDKEHGSTRIVMSREDSSEKRIFLDFTDFRGKDICEDLLHRDFTINSLAIELGQIKKANSLEDILFDPYQARKDIEKRTIRIISRHSFPEDPLRILRAFSLSAGLGFKIEPKTIAQIKRYKKKIPSCAFERITEELFKILDSPNAFKTMSLMDAWRILDEIIPEIKNMRGVKQGPYHHLDVYRHSLETLKQLEIVFCELKRNKDVQNYLDEVISGTRTRRALVKLAAFLHDIGKPEAKEHFEGKTRFHGHEKIGKDMVRDIAERLRLSNDERGALARIIFWHLRPGYIADMEKISSRASFRYFRDTAGEAVSVLLLSIADQRSTRGPLTRGNDRKHHEDVCLGLVREFFRKAKGKKVGRLINGDDLIKHLKLEPGPLIGKILAEVEEAQAAGEVKTQEEALELARGFI